ncbi:apolipoprotein N-acyltransferase [Umezakia ovalisporum]|uniref:Apolipoprotein N-acyltransferase n=2 Tax=Umezakia ovalisporum TaxID=75695 RepID=A0AA43KHC2_9CYAN|nr:apolipoprotein N-acyltransferase [Umezakia ovalisporum]MDH6056218.1 apolipoprotein N-acyltransferase [Umezakia ovalisporum FSS-43]MDH6065640.1 apolipoprotein N-acyltransferase [Umezakia ovalisporum FSS-62]MDH6065885.1 apolipoprotein N-acyltransferase [Umezakia ovalisporum APH033B]MDH6072089.1 apolipoprotein N-acyltransferase [Umezakia ovalisporum CobakiLakeA]MDH6073982.1 apolipoprotein N-acyltransferase [Umezakia ovalisporum CS-1034]
MSKKLSKKPREMLIALLPYSISLTSGVFMGLTVAPVNAWFLAWIAIAPVWVLIVTNAQSKKSKSPLLALTWGIGYHGVALSWITGIHPMDWLGVPWLPSLIITLFCWLFISLYGGLLVTLWGAAMARFPGQRSWKRVLFATAIWCGLESLWSASPLWWSSLAYTQSPHNLVILHLGQISGANTVTAAIVAVNGLIAEAWINHQSRNFSTHSQVVKQHLAIATSLFITLHILGFYLYTRPLAQPPAAALKVGIIQGNIPNEIKLIPQGLRRALAGYTSGYYTLVDQGVDAVLTPEAALPYFQRDLPNTSLIQAVREKAVIAWVGAFGEQGRSYTNSLFTFIGNGEVVSRYDKTKLVPLGEYIPFEGILGSIIQRLSPLDAHQVPGKTNQIFDTPFGRAIVGICYDSAFPEIFRRQAAAGGQFILSSSNDAHYSPSMPFQHHALDMMRAIETDRWSVRATNTGYSAFVDPHGHTLWISGYNTYETHTEIIYRRLTQTLYVRWGDWLTVVLLALSVLAYMKNHVLVEAVD